MNLFEELQKRADAGSTTAQSILDDWQDRWHVGRDLGKVERQALWQCKDGWLAGYTTTRVVGGPHDGKFLVMAYKPVGKGARSGKAEEFVMVYERSFVKRKDAKARAMELWEKHGGS